MMNEFQSLMSELKQLIAHASGQERVVELEANITTITAQLQALVDSIRPPAPTVALTIDPVAPSAATGTASLRAQVAGHATGVTLDDGTAFTDLGGGVWGLEVANTTPVDVQYDVTAVGLGGSTTASITVLWTA